MFREDVDVEAVFLHPDEPELEFVGFLKKKYPRVRYFQGSLMESIDLERVQVIIKKKYSRVRYFQGSCKKSIDLRDGSGINKEKVSKN